MGPPIIRLKIAIAYKRSKTSLKYMMIQIQT